MTLVGGGRPDRRLAAALRPAIAAFVLVAAPAVPAAATPEPAPVPAIAVLARIEAATLPPPPFFVGLAHVIAPPGAATTTAGTAGPRLIVVETGTLTVATGDASSDLGAGPQSPTTLGAPGSGATELAAGDQIVIEPGGVREIRNDGSRPAIYLDAAIFPAGPEPPDGALTTPEGFSFQLLAGVTVEQSGLATADVVLERVAVPPGGDLPPTARSGPALAYVESGALHLLGGTGQIRYSRAAAAAPASAAGPLRPLPAATAMTLTAGGSLFLPAGSTIAAENQRGLPALLLMVELAPVGG